MQRLRSERVERTFAHLCDTGGARRTWLRGLEKVHKRYMSAAMAYNLGRIMRSLLGAGKPRHLAVLAERRRLAQLAMLWLRITCHWAVVTHVWHTVMQTRPIGRPEAAAA